MGTTNREMQDRFERLRETLPPMILIDEFWHYLDSDTLHDFIETAERDFGIGDDEEDEDEWEDEDDDYIV
jgi:hypothetical protein